MMMMMMMMITWFSDFRYVDPSRRYLRSHSSRQLSKIAPIFSRPY